MNRDSLLHHHLEFVHGLGGLLGRSPVRRGDRSELDHPDRAVSQWSWPPAHASLGSLIGLAQALDTRLTDVGIQITRGRVYLQRFRLRFPPDGTVTVVVELGGVCWLGPSDRLGNNLGPGITVAETKLSPSGRLYLRRALRDKLAVADGNAFRAVVVPAPIGGVTVVPIEGFARRLGVAA